MARQALDAVALDNSANIETFREDLLNIARTTLSSKILSQHKEHFSKLAVDAVLRLKGSGELQVSSVQNSFRFFSLAACGLMPYIYHNCNNYI